MDNRVQKSATYCGVCPDVLNEVLVEWNQDQELVPNWLATSRTLEVISKARRSQYDDYSDDMWRRGTEMQVDMDEPLVWFWWQFLCSMQVTKACSILLFSRASGLTSEESDTGKNTSLRPIVEDGFDPKLVWPLNMWSMLREWCIHRDRTTAMATRTTSTRTTRELEPWRINISTDRYEAVMTHERCCIANEALRFPFHAFEFEPWKVQDTGKFKLSRVQVGCDICPSHWTSIAYTSAQYLRPRATGMRDLVMEWQKRANRDRETLGMQRSFTQYLTWMYNKGFFSLWVTEPQMVRRYREIIHFLTVFGSRNERVDVKPIILHIHASAV